MSVDPRLSLTFDAVLEEHARSRPDRLAVVDGDRRLTFAELQDRVAKLAGALSKAGAHDGARILWLGQNSFRVLELFLAAARTGAMMCPANWRQSADELCFVIDDLEPAVIVWQRAEISDRVQEARAASGSTGLWVCHDADGDDTQPDSPYESFLAEGAPLGPGDSVDPLGGLLAMYTAAFEGRPNAAVLSHVALLMQNLVMGRALGITDESVNLNSGPLFHIATFSTTTTTFHHGGANVFTPRVEAEDVCRLIENERCTHAFLMRPTIEQIRDDGLAEKYDLSSLWDAPDPDRYRGGMIAPASSPWTQLPGGYGQTEVVGLATFAGQGAPTDGRAGRPSPAAQLRIVDDAGGDVAAGDVGEIVLRGPVVMNEFWNRADLNTARSAGGWHHSNDLGRREVDGSITFIGPKARLIKSAAENIYPTEVEAALASHPAVAAVCVIGVPDPTWKQAVRAVVVLRDDAAADETELIDHCRDRIASYKKPRSVVFTGALPRTAAGAVDRDAVDAAFGGGGYPGEPI